MAEERSESREATWRQLFPWTELFRAFQVALDLNKLLLAAAGIGVMAFGWWLLAVIFSTGEEKTPPDWPGAFVATDTKDWAEFRKRRMHWNLMNEAVGLKADAQIEVKDVAETLREYELFSSVQGSPDPRKAFLDLVSKYDKENPKEFTPDVVRRYQAKASQYARVGQVKPSGLLYVAPWYEDRGPNPFLLVTGQAGLPWEAGYFWEWFSRDQAPVMVEPLVKFLRPILYFLSPVNSFASATYFLCVSLFTLITWSVFGGAITRIAAVQLARGEKIGVFEAMRFTLKRFLSYAIAPLFVLGFCGLLTAIMALLYLIGMIPVVGDFLSGLLYPIYFVMGLLMAIALVGLVGWPLMSATISTEGTDSWEAVSRSYSYVYQRPWHFIWYSLVSIAYGGVCIFFIGFMASFSVYLAKWGMSKAPFSQSAEREPNFLFVYAPTSFGWRELLLEGTPVRIPEGDPRFEKYQRFNGADVVQPRSARTIAPTGTATTSRWNRIDPENYDVYLKTLAWWNKLGAVLTAIWLFLIFLLMLGFGYSFFWTSSTIIYFLLRKSVDAAEMDEVYLEEDDYEPPFQAAPPATPAGPAAVTASPRSLPVITTGPTPAPAPAPAPVPATPPAAEPAPAPSTAVAPTPEVAKTSSPPPEPPKPPDDGAGKPEV